MAVLFAVAFAFPLAIASSAQSTTPLGKYDSTLLGTSNQERAIARGAGKFSVAKKVDDLDLWSVDSLVKVFRDAKPNAETPPTIDVARGEVASLQVVFRSTRPVTGLSARLSNPFDCANANPQTLLTDVNIRFVGYVPVNRPTQWRDKDQLRRTPEDYPDPLLVEESLNLVEGHAQPIWLSIPIPLNATAGDYQGEVEVTGNAEGDDFVGVIPVSVRVHDVTIKQTRMWSSCWFGPQMKKMGIASDAFSPEYWSLVRKFAKNLAQHRQNVIKVSPDKLCEFSVGEKGEILVDFSRFDKTVQLFIDEGVIGRIEGDPLGRRINGWNTPFVVNIRTVVDGKIVKGTAPPDSAEADDYCRWYLMTLASHLKEKGWKEIFMQHLGDEPTWKTRESYYQLSKLARKYAPGIKLIEATHTHALPDDTIDVWMPLLSTLSDNYEGFKKRRDAGAEIWTYTCLHPQGGWANRLIEQPLLKTRLLSWINFRYGIAGHLNWGYNSWRSDDPFTQLTPKGGPGYLPAGDAWMVYPSPNGPLDSIRYEAWRDGSTDHELLSMLADIDPDAAHRIALTHILSFDKYNIDIKKFRASRQKLLTLLSNRLISNK